MNADEDKPGKGPRELTREQLDRITYRVNGCAYRVSNGLGPGFPEKLYERAMVIEMELAGLHVATQVPAPVFYRGRLLGQFRADFTVEKSVLVEIKASQKHADVYEAQCLSYLKATGLRVCLLLNFGHPKVDIRRIVNNF